MFEFVLVVLWIGLGGASLLWGLEYYLLPIPDRAYSALAEQFAPTGFVGHGLGIVGTIMITVGVIGYGLRKRIPSLARAGALKRWLQVHIFLCTLGPFFVVLHTSFKVGGLVAVSFWSMMVVVASGVLGRYLYVRIPKSVNGRFLDLEAVKGRTQELAEGIVRITGTAEDEWRRLLAAPDVPLRPVGMGTAMALAVRGDLGARAQRIRIRRALKAKAVPGPIRKEVLSLASEQARLRHQMILLQPFQRMFRYWHVVHLPLAIVMFLVLGVHVAVAVMFGYTWVF